MKAVLLAAHLRVMSAIAGSDAFYTGLVCDARPEAAGAERVLGNYLNTVPFAMPAGARTWGELITAVYRSLTDMWPHRVLPIQVIQQESGRAGRMLEIFFNYLDFHQVDKEIVDWDRTFTDSENEFALHVYTISGVLRLNTTNHRLARASAERLAVLYRAVLEDLARGPEGDVDTACRQLLGAESSSVATPVHSLTVPELFATSVREQPDAVAVRQGTETLTYAELDRWSDQMASRLRSGGVAPGSRVAVVPGHDPGTVAALFAVWKAGAVAVLSEAEPRQRPQVVAVVVASTSDTVAGQGEVPLFTTHDLRQATGAEVHATAQRSADTACLASAEDGPQVWAVLSHGALANAVTAAQAALEAVDAALLRTSRWVSPTALPTWQTLGEMLLPLTCGGTLVLTHAPVPEAVPEITELVDSGVSHLPAASALADAVFGAASSVPTVAALVSGPTSGLPAAERHGARSVTVAAFASLPGWVALDGRPVPGHRLHVLDSRLRPAPLGVIGELAVGGPGLPDAFHDAPALTAERLVPDPFGAASSRLLLTGHLARYAPDGTLEVLSAIKSTYAEAAMACQVREARIAQSSVRDAFVMLDPEAPEEHRRSIGYVRGVPGGRLDTEDLCRWLVEQQLPRHLVPDLFQEVEHWPLAPDGSIAVELLPVPAEPSTSGDAPDRPWDDQFEQLIRDIRSEDHANAPLDPALPLADLGIDSFTTVRLLLMLERAYDITVTEDVQIVDHFRTPRTLWGEIERLRASSPGQPTC